MATQLEKERRKKSEKKMYIVIGIVAYLIASLTYLHSLAAREQNPRLSFGDSINEGFSRIITHPFEIFPLNGAALFNFLLFSAVAGLLAVMYVSERALRKHDNPDTVNGEAHLMNTDELEEYNKKFASPLGSPEINGENNMIISKDIRLAIDNRGTRRNCNILVIGGSGAGKSRFFAAPNILQYNCNFVITDPSGEMLRDYGKALEDQGYAVKVFNLTDAYKSSRYNPFHYIKEEKDVFILVNTLIKNTNPSDGKGGDPFWENSEKLLLTALILYLWYTQPEEKQTFSEVLNLLTLAQVDENDATAKSDLDRKFDELEKDDIDKIATLAVRQYKKFKIGAGKTLKSILISVGVRLQTFELADIQYLTNTDDFEFEKFADTKQALFVIIPTADTTFNFIVSLLYSQLFTSLYLYGETRAEFGWKASIDQYTNIKVEQAASKEYSAVARAKLEEYIAQIQKGVKVVHDKEKQLYNVYARHRKSYYVLMDNQKGRADKKLYENNNTGYAFEDKKEADDYIKNNNLVKEAFVSDTTVYLEDAYFEKILIRDLKNKQNDKKSEKNVSATLVIKDKENDILRRMEVKENRTYRLLMVSELYNKDGVGYAFEDKDEAVKYIKENNLKNIIPSSSPVFIDKQYVLDSISRGVSSFMIKKNGKDEIRALKPDEEVTGFMLMSKTNKPYKKGVYGVAFETAYDKDNKKVDVHEYIKCEELDDIFTYVPNKEMSVGSSFDEMLFKTGIMELAMYDTDGNSYIRKTGEKIGWRGTKEATKKFMEKLKNIKIEKCEPKCPNHVRLILDEFANIGQIPDFNEKLATMRKYEISCSIILQALSQLKEIYDKKWNTIVSNCDTKLFLGCDDSETIEWMLKMLGKKTTTVQNTSFNGDKGGSTSLNKSSLELLTIDQISMMQDNECLVRIRGVRPYYGKKYEITNHPNYQYAHDTAGMFTIPLSKDVKERKKGSRAALYKGESLAKQMAKTAKSDPENSVQPHDMPDKELQERMTSAKNSARMQEAKEAQDALDNFNEFAPESDEDVMMDICAAFGLKEGMTGEEIKERVETLIALDNPPEGKMTYSATA